MRNKILGLILVMCMLLGGVHTAVNAAESGSCGINASWTLDGGVLTISGTGDMTDYSYGLSPWYDSRLKITEIVIENGVTGIGRMAFSGCDNLESVSIPPSVSKIGNSAFSSHCKITRIYISDLAAWLSIDGLSNMLTYTWNWNLYINNELTTNIVIPEGATVCEDAFKRCASITDVSVPQSVTEICDDAFLYCPNLTNVKIAGGLERIGDDVFYGCGNLLSIEVDESNESFMSDNGILFDKARTKLLRYPPKKAGASYTIPDSVTYIEWSAFAECKNIEKIDIPDSVNFIGGYAFEECSNLLSLTIPDGVTEINWGVAAECEKLSEIKFPDSITTIAMYAIDGTAYYNDDANWPDGVLYVNNCLMEVKDTLSGFYQVRDGTVAIGDCAFSQGAGLTGVSIPDSVQSIGDDAFYGTALYDDVSNWVDNALYIDDCLIAADRDLSGDYRIKDGTRLIAGYAFGRADRVTSITIPKSVTRISALALYNLGKEFDFVFEAPVAVRLSESVFKKSVGKIYIHEGYTGYTAENGYDESKMVIVPHSYEDGACTVCGAKEDAFLIERVDAPDDAEYAFSVKPRRVYENCYVYSAIYDVDGAVITVKRAPLKTAEDTRVSAGKSEKDKTARVFVWTENIQPVGLREFILNGD